jgi:hypothetical protein
MSQRILTEYEKSDKTKIEILGLIKSNSNDIPYEKVLGKIPKKRCVHSYKYFRNTIMAHK